MMRRRQAGGVAWPFAKPLALFASEVMLGAGLVSGEVLYSHCEFLDGAPLRRLWDS
jgi:hypothetical protein